MRILKTIAAVALVAFSGMTANAQECTGGAECQEAEELGYKPYPYNFIQAQGGANTVFTDVNCFKLLSPTASIGIGRMFSPIVGARVHVNAWETRGGFDNIRTQVENPHYGDVAERPQIGAQVKDPLKYRYNYINTNVDLMVNVINIFSKKCHNPFELYAIAGLGLNYAWHNNQFQNIVSTYDVPNDISNAWGRNQKPRKELLSHNLRLGLLADCNISKNVSIGAEFDFNSLDDRFNSKYNNSDDWMFTAQLSLTYKFGFKKPCKHTPAPVVVTPAPKPTPIVEQPKDEKPAVVVEKTPLKETIFYAIRENDPNPDQIINKVVEWSKKYPEGKITISGYADKGTGNPTLNEGYAQRRADAVFNTLKSKGVPASQMTANSFGDKVQPFEDNDKNRCVIIVGSF